MPIKRYTLIAPSIYRERIADFEAIMASDDASEAQKQNASLLRDDLFIALLRFQLTTFHSGDKWKAYRNWR